MRRAYVDAASQDQSPRQDNLPQLPIYPEMSMMNPSTQDLVSRRDLKLQERERQLWKRWGVHATAFCLHCRQTTMN